MLANYCWKEILFSYICPSLGCILSAAMYAAPVQDLKLSLVKKRLGPLNPIPWAVMTGNCLGWCIYSYYTSDPFILASNIPGLLASIWLNTGAAKLQYYEKATKQQQQQQQPSSSNSNSTNFSSSTSRGQQYISEGLPEEEEDIDSPLLLVFVQQEVLLLRILVIWIVILIVVGWIVPNNSNNYYDNDHHHHQQQQQKIIIIGILVNINLLLYYASPLQSIFVVMKEQCSDSIHRPTMVMNYFNTTFWLLYGIFGKEGGGGDPIIYVPNSIGLFFGLIQGILCYLYPKKVHPLSLQYDDDDEEEEEDDEEEEEEEIGSSFPSSLVEPLLST